MSHVEDCRALKTEVHRFAEVMSSLPSDREIQSCPGWTVHDLAEHLGVIHRWADELVQSRSTKRLAREVTAATSAAVSPEWIEDGGMHLVRTLLDADANDEMWAWGRDQHVRFWSRRQLHETLVHRMDLELAAHIEPQAEPLIAEDAIDEFLSNLEATAKTISGRSVIRGNVERLALRIRDSTRLWSIELRDDDFSVGHDEAPFTTELIGSPVDLLLVTLRRRAVEKSDVLVKGDNTLLDFWLSHSDFD